MLNVCEKCYKCFWVIKYRNGAQKSLATNFLWPKFQHHCSLHSRALSLYVLDCNVLFCKMPSFRQACSITIPMNTSLLWEITLETILCLNCSPERIRIAIALRKTAKPETNFLQFAVYRWCWINISLYQQ